MRLPGRFVMLALGLVAAACAQPAPAPAAPPKPDLVAEEQAIRAVDAQWAKAVQARDAAAEAAVLAPDGVAYRPHVEPLDPAGYQAYEATFFKDNPKGTATWTTDKIQVAESGEMAVQIGVLNVTGLGPKGDGSDTGRFLTVWKKVNGSWKVAYDMGSTTVPEPPATKK